MTKKRVLKNLLFWTVSAVIIFSVAASLRIFIYCSFYVPSDSMRPTLEAGDNILVTKLIPGPRVYPHFPKFKDKKGKVETKRFCGIRKIRRNDVTVFNFPCSDPNRIEMNISVNYVKRCVAQ